MGRSFTPSGGASTPFEGQELLSAFVCTPLQANVNDYRVAQRQFDNASLLSISAITALNITGLQGATPYRELVLINTGANAITLKDASGLSLAPNRFHFGADVILAQNQGVKLIAFAAGGWGAEGGAGGGAPPVVPLSSSLSLQAANQSIPGGSNRTPIAFDTVLDNSGGFWAAGNPTRMTAPAAGNYLLTASCIWDTAAAGECFLMFGVNGSYAHTFAIDGAAFSVGVNAAMSISAILPLALGDFVEAVVSTSTSSAVNVLGSGSPVNTLFAMMAIH